MGKAILMDCDRGDAKEVIYAITRSSWPR